MLTLMLSLIAFQQDTQIQEQISVGRTVLEVRVLDSSGNPILGLEADDFVLTRRGERVPLVSCRWVEAIYDAEVDESEGEYFDPDSEVDEAADDLFWDSSPRDTIEGRIVVFFFQKDGSAQIGHHLVRTLRFAREGLADLHENDYVAVISFDTSLRLNLDLTRDHDRASDAFSKAVTKNEGLPWGQGGFPSIGAAIPRFQADRVHHTTPALMVVADALARLPGSKTMIFLGQGFLNSEGELKPWGLALRALRESNTTVYVLDANNAERHTREAMLLDLAEKTGGFYYRMFNSPQNAFPKIERVMRGHYELVYDTAITGGDPVLRISVSKRHFEILVADPVIPVYGRDREP